MRHDHPARKVRFPRALFTLSGPLLAAFAGFGASAALAAGTSGEVGVWYNQSGKGAVEIRPCGRALCGFIVWLKEPNNKNGQPLTDGYNSEPSKRRRPICGLPVLGDLRRMPDGGWDEGWVYDPEQGKSFDAAIQLSSQDRLILTGYQGVKFFSKSFTWKRAPADLPRCDKTPLEREANASIPPANAPTPVSTPSAQPPVRAASAQPPVPDKAAEARATQASQEVRIVPPPPVPAVRRASTP